MVGRVMQGRMLVDGEGEGRALVSGESLSFWGGYDQATGEIIDRRHPLSGQNAAGRVLCLPGSRGSSTTTAVLLEAVRQGNAPAAILTCGVDAFLALASIVADELYHRPIPIAALTRADFEQLETGQLVTIRPNGRVEVRETDD